MGYRRQLIKARQLAGQTLVEVLMAMGLAAVLLPALLTGLVASREGKAQQLQRGNAITLVREGLDAIRTIRETSWDAVATAGAYHPATSSGTWVLVPGAESINGYTRSIVISDVLRDSWGQIASSGGTVDPSTKLIDVIVSWATPTVSAIDIPMYVTRYLDDLSYIRTLISDFSAGTNSGTAVVATGGTGIPNDGQVQLGAGGSSDWCAPNLSITPLDLPGNGFTTAISATTSATSDYAYTTTGYNASGDSMDAVIISQGNPPVATNSGSYINRKTYGIYVDNPNKFVYLASNHPGLTVDIVQVTSQPYSQTGTFSASGGGAGNDVFTAFNSALGYDIGYVTAGNYLYSYNLSSKSGARAQLGQVQLGGTGGRVIVVGDYAYVTTQSTTEQLDIVDVSNPANLSVVARFNAGNNREGVDLYVSNNGSRVYLVTEQGSPTVNDFFIINTTNKGSIAQVGGGVYNTGVMNPTGVTVVPGNRVIIVGSGGEQYQVLNIDSESSPSHCGGLTNPNGATAINAIAGIQRADQSAYSYILTNTASKELQIIQGGPGGAVSVNGTYESATFSLGYQSAFNRFLASVNQPNQTSIKMQVAVAAAISGVCNSVAFTYLGPGGDPAAFFTPVGASISGAIPFGTVPTTYQNPGRCFRYKAYLSSTNQNSTPVLYDVAVNYTP